MNFYKVLFLFCLLNLILNCQRQATDNDIIIPPGEPSQWYQEPVWLPNGEFIAFTFYKVYPESIFLVNPNTKLLKPVTRGRGADFSSDGQNLVLNIGNQIYIYNFETGSIQQLTNYGNNYSPNWSSDGRKIVYDSNFKDSSGANVIWIMDADGSNKRDISQHGIGEWRQPFWMPNYNILHIRYAGREDPDIFIMDSTGNNAIRLTNSEWNSYPRISPDGNKIVWQKWDLHDNVDIYIMDVDGNNKSMLIKGGREPAWSPNGQKIVFWKWGNYSPGEPWDDNDPDVHGSLWILYLDSMVQHRLL
jgi:TolB protein